MVKFIEKSENPMAIFRLKRPLTNAKTCVMLKLVGLKDHLHRTAVPQSAITPAIAAFAVPLSGCRSGKNRQNRPRKPSKTEKNFSGF